jgi:hypothetical protein
LPREIYAKQPLYAHFDTFGKVPPNVQVMVRWTQRDTGEILLFTPRKVSENQQNWVSFIRFRAGIPVIMMSSTTK